MERIAISKDLRKRVITETSASDILTKRQNLFILWLLIALPTDYFGLAPNGDGTYTVNNTPAGADLDKLVSELKALVDVNGVSVVRDLIDNVQTLLADGTNPGTINLSVQVDGGKQVLPATISYGAALGVTRALYGKMQSLAAGDYDPDPSCMFSDIISLVPKFPNH